MKITCNILSFLFVGTLVLVSCHRDEIPGTYIPVEGGRPIEFSSVYATVNTKTETGEASALPANFKVWASRTKENFDPNYNVFGDAGTIVTNNGTSDSPKWTYSPVRYWQSGDYNFVAITPINLASGKLTENGLELSFGTNGWDLSTNQTDLLLARSNASNQIVSLAFSHILSKISFSARNSKTMTTEITSLKISGYHNVASSMLYADRNAVWQFNDYATTTKEVLSSTSLNLSSTLTKITSDILVFPENCEVNIEVTVRHGQNASFYKKTAKIEATDWLPGKQYDYIINISPESIHVTSTQVKDWVSDINGNNNNDDDINHNFE